MAGAAKHTVDPGYVVQGTILSVNSKTHVAEVALDNIHGALPDVQVAALYCHPAGGEGIYFLPEPDATCYVFFPSDGSRPFVLGYVMPPTPVEGDAGGREDLNPGDIVLSTRDDNFVILRRGGVVQIGSSALSQRLYVPLSNFIRDFFENYEALSPLGKISWIHDEVTGLQTKVRYHFDTKEFAEDPLPRLTVEVFEDTDHMPEGYTNTEADVPDPFLPKLSYLRVLADNGLGLQNNYVFQISKDGDLFCKTEGYLLLESKGPFRIHGREGVTVLGPTIKLVSASVAIGSGDQLAVARETDPVKVTIPIGAVIVPGNPPAPNESPIELTGTITSGSEIVTSA